MREAAANAAVDAARPIEVFRPELQAFPLRAILDEAEGALGRPALEDLLAPYGVTLEDLSDRSCWVSLRFVEALMKEVEEHVGDPAFVDHAMKRAITARYIGPLYPLFVALASPSFTYRQLPVAAARIDKTGGWICEELRPGRVRMIRTHNEGAPHERESFLCRLRVAQFQRIPTLFNRPPAEVRHTTCILRGDPACTFDVDWSEPAAMLHGAFGLLAGVAIAGLLLAFATLPFSIAAVVAVGLGVGGWSLGRLWIMRREVRQRVEDIAEHKRALERMTKDNEKRFAELVEAKKDVEKKVDLRTAELREATAKLEGTLEVLREIDRTKTDFFNAISHELRTPLTLIVEPLRMIVEGEEPPGGRNAALQTMYANAAQLRTLIDDLLDLAKIDAGAMPLNPAPVDAVSLARSVTTRFETAASTRGVELLNELPEGRVETILDPNWIQRALANLVGNALRHVKAGGRITLRLLVEDDDIVLEVEDTGEGIDTDDLERVFLRFGQAKGRRGGTGLGLAIVQEVARLHGGEATVRSERGRGATFALRLHRGAVDKNAVATPPEQAVTVHEAGASPPPIAATDTPLSPAPPAPYPNAPLALIVEDQPDIRRFVALALATRYRVRTAPDGARGLELAHEETPDIVVSDVAMPVMGGLELCRALRDEEATRSVPVILLTGAGDPKTVIQGFEAGANDYVLKPFATQELLARVNVHVRLRSLIHEVGRRERLATLGTVAASVAHQIRNPLTTLVSGLPAMRRRIGEQLDPSSREMLDTMLDCAERIERTTGDLLDLSRVDRAADDEYKPSDGLMAAVRLARTRVASADVVLDVTVDEEPVLRGRPGDINQVFLNLLDNAAREVAQGGTVGIHAAVEGDAYVVRIGDSGRGIPEDDLPHLFEPFWTTRPAGQGTGLGLSIAKEVVEQHGGAIEVGRSQLGGALFTVRLPLRRGSPDAPAATALSA